jgi:hypothetical protein
MLKSKSHHAQLSQVFILSFLLYKGLIEKRCERCDLCEVIIMRIALIGSS